MKHLVLPRERLLFIKKNTSENMLKEIKQKNFTMKIGTKVQYKKYFSKRAKGIKSKVRYYPAQSYLVIHRIFRTKKKVILRNPKTGYIHKKNCSFDNIRPVKKLFKRKKFPLKR